MTDSAVPSHLTFRSAPSSPLRFGDGVGTQVATTIDATPDRVWDLISDINVPARFSDEFLGAEWTSDRRGVGATFVGHNRHEAIGEWDMLCFVSDHELNVRFGWITSDLSNPGAQWRFDLDPDGTGTRLTYSMVLGPGPSGLTVAIDSLPDAEERILIRRATEHHRAMETVVAGIKELAEHPPGGTLG